MIWKYSIVVEGSGIRVESEDEPMIGFFANRVLWASDTKAAISKAEALILDDWTHGSYRDMNTGSIPTLRVESVISLSFFWSFFTRSQKKGYVFYPDRDS